MFKIALSQKTGPRVYQEVGNKTGDFGQVLLIGLSDFKLLRFIKHLD